MVASVASVRTKAVIGKSWKKNKDSLRLIIFPVSQKTFALKDCHRCPRIFCKTEPYRFMLSNKTANGWHIKQ